MIRLGRHSSRARVGADIRHAGEHAVQFVAAQVFAGDPRKYDLEDFAAAIPPVVQTYIVHSAYVDVPWSASPVRGVARKHLAAQLRAAAADPRCEGVIVHLNEAPPDDVVGVAKRLALRRGGTRAALFLEHVASKACRYCDAKALGRLARRLARAWRQGHQVGVCIDTAHVWAGGHDISAYAGAAAWMNTFLGTAGPLGGMPLTLALNDNRFPCGAGKDQHSLVGQGAIWGEFSLEDFAADYTGATAFLQAAAAHDMTVILERSEKLDLAAEYPVLKALGL